MVIWRVDGSKGPRWYATYEEAVLAWARATDAGLCRVHVPNKQALIAMLYETLDEGKGQ